MASTGSGIYNVQLCEHVSIISGLDSVAKKVNPSSALLDNSATAKKWRSSRTPLGNSSAANRMRIVRPSMGTSAAPHIMRITIPSVGTSAAPHIMRITIPSVGTSAGAKKLRISKKSLGNSTADKEFRISKTALGNSAVVGIVKVDELVYCSHYNIDVLPFGGPAVEISAAYAGNTCQHCYFSITPLPNPRGTHPERASPCVIQATSATPALLSDVRAIRACDAPKIREVPNSFPCSRAFRQFHGLRGPVSYTHFPERNFYITSCSLCVLDAVIVLSPCVCIAS